MTSRGAGFLFHCGSPSFVSLHILPFKKISISHFSVSLGSFIVKIKRTSLFRDREERCENAVTGSVASIRAEEDVLLLATSPQQQFGIRPKQKCICRGCGI